MQWYKNPNIAIIVVGLVTGAAGIAILRMTGVHFSATIPPGIIILPLAAIFIAFAPWRWAPGVGAFIGLYATVGFVIKGGLSDLVGHRGVGVATGHWIQLTGLLTALIAGARGLVVNYRADKDAISTKAQWPSTARPRTVFIVSLVAATALNISMAAGALVSRALVSFAYYPVVGDVSATRKYLHNGVLLVTVVVTWSLAAWRAGLQEVRETCTTVQGAG